MNLESGVLQVHIEDIIPNRFQPRLAFDEQGLKELSDSIREHGIIQPLVLRKLGDKYEIIAGERRYKAAQIAGLTTVPAVIANIDDNKSAEVALVENIQRRDLTAIEEARSYKNLLDKGYLTQDQLAKRMGLSQPAIANKLRLLNLDEEVQQALLEEKISERHARTLLTLQDKDAQREWLHRVINERLTVRQLDLELKKIKYANNLVAEGEEDEGTGDVPLVSGIPSLEDIKANAMDISQANKMETLSPVQSSPETLETLDMSPMVTSTPEVQPESLFNDPLANNNFTTATTIPEFNIATPNSSSTFLPAENLTNNVDNNRFFGVPESLEPTPMNQTPLNPMFEPVSNMTNNTGELEIFDAPTVNNSFTTEPMPEVQPEPLKNDDVLVPLNTMNQTNPLDLSPNNRFFTPTPELRPEVVLETKKETEVDPMAAVDKLTEEYQDTPKAQETSGMGLKDAIATIRTCIEGLGDKGFFIDVEEIDFENNYQITMRIHKDN